MSCAPLFIHNADLRQDLQLKLIIDVIKQLATNTYTRASTCNHQLIHQIPHYDQNNIPRHRRPKQGIIPN